MRIARAMTIVVVVLGTMTFPGAHQRVEAIPEARQGSFPIAAEIGVSRAASTVDRLPWRANMVGLSWRSEDDHADGVSAAIRGRSGDTWGPWYDLVVEPEEGPAPGAERGMSERVFTLPQWVGTVDDLDVRVWLDDEAAPISDVRIEAINTKGDADRPSVIGRVLGSVGSFLTARAIPPASAQPSKPTIISRAAWGADESLRSPGPGIASGLKMAIVHHTANSNAYTKDESAALVRGIYRYHTLGRGYSDIGYNFLIDRYGQVFEGRAGGIKEPVIGGHAGAFNSYSTGVALIGTFSSSSPPSKMVTALVKLLAWKLDVHHVPPTGKVWMTALSDGSKYSEGERVKLHRISGHRHVSATTCPGGATVSKFPSIRDRVERRGNPKIYEPTVSTDVIRPSGDGVDDVAHLTASISRTSEWTLRITNALGLVVFARAGTGTAIDETWDGTIGGVPVPAGRYTWELDATRTTNGRTARAATGTIDVLSARPAGCSGCYVTGPVADFNGDGFSDLALGVPGEDMGSTVDAGGVNVLYGSAEGLTADDDAFFADGVADQPERGDRFGASLAAADFDGDGFSDLAVGTPGQRVNGRAGAGAVTVIYGSETGLDRDRTQRWHQGAAGTGGKPEVADSFGAALTPGDFTGDGRADLVIGVPGEDLGKRSDAGMVVFLRGSDTGLIGVAPTGLSQERDGVPGRGETGDLFGSSLAAGDLDGNGKDDLIVGSPGETISGSANAGMLHVFPGGTSGPKVTGSFLWHQGVAGTADGVDAADRVAFALSAGDVNGDGYDDVAVGIPGEDFATADTGAVTVLFGTSSGLRRTGDQLIHRGLVELGSSGSAGDGFGSALVLADLDADGMDDLAVGAPGDDVDDVQDAGSITILMGSGSGLAVVGADLWHLDSSGIKGTPSEGNLFGWSLATGDFDGDTFADLVIGTPGFDRDGASQVGAASVFYGSATGFEGRDQRWHQDTPGVIGVAESADLLGVV